MREILLCHRNLRKHWQDAEKVRQRRARIAQRPQRTEAYASPLRSLRPCWTAFLRILKWFWCLHRTETSGHIF